MKIRHAKLSDKHQILEFCKMTFSWGDYIADVWESWYSKYGLYVLEGDEKLLGVYNLADLGRETWVEGMRVHPQYRRMGLGRSMLEHAESFARTGPIRLVVESKNKPSIKLVKSMGYQIEARWRLFTMIPEKTESDVIIAENPSQIKDVIKSSTYVDSWRWVPLDEKEIISLINDRKILISVTKGNTEAIGILGKSSYFPRLLQVGYLGGTNNGMENILRYVQMKGLESNSEKIQVFVPEDGLPSSDFLDKRSMFYLMRKDLVRKIYNS